MVRASNWSLLFHSETLTNTIQSCQPSKVNCSSNYTILSCIWDHIHNLFINSLVIKEQNDVFADFFGAFCFCCPASGGKAKPLKAPKAEKKEYDEVLFLKAIVLNFGIWFVVIIDQLYFLLCVCDVWCEFLYWIFEIFVFGVNCWDWLNFIVTKEFFGAFCFLLPCIIVLFFCSWCRDAYETSNCRCNGVYEL